MLQSLMNSPIAWLVLAIMTVISFVYAFYCQKVNKERKELSYAQDTDVLIYNQTSKFQKLKISYGDEIIDNLCVTKFAIWNSGNRVLEKGDFVVKKALAISALNEKQILEATVVNVTEKENKFHLKPVGKTKVDVEFDYIAPENGVIIQIIHTGSRKDLEITSMIKGGEPIKQVHKEGESDNKNKVKKRKRRFIMGLIAMIVYFIMGIYMIIMGIAQKYRKVISDAEILKNYYNSKEIFPLLYWATGFVIIVAGIMFLRILLRSSYLGIPSKIKKAFMEEDD